MEVYTLKTIENCPYTATIPQPPSVPHKSTFFKIVCVEEGMAEVNFWSRRGGKTIKKDVQINDCFIITPDDVHSYTIPKNISYRHRDIYVIPESMKSCCESVSSDLFNKLVNGEYPEIFTISANTSLSIAEMLSFMVNKKVTLELDKIHKSVVTYMLGMFLARQQNLQVYPAWLNELLRNLGNEEFVNLPIKTIAESTNYSHGYICRQFKIIMNTTLKKYVNETRLAYSTIMLTNTQHSVEEIALRLGFTTLSNYINLFRERYNTTPKQYRIKYKNSINTESYNEWGEMLKY